MGSRGSQVRVPSRLGDPAALACGTPQDATCGPSPSVQNQDSTGLVVCSRSGLS